MEEDSKKTTTELIGGCLGSGQGNEKIRENSIKREATRYVKEAGPRWEVHLMG